MVSPTMVTSSVAVRCAPSIILGHVPFFIRQISGARFVRIFDSLIFDYIYFILYRCLIGWPNSTLASNQLSSNTNNPLPCSHMWTIVQCFDEACQLVYFFLTRFYSFAFFPVVHSTHNPLSRLYFQHSKRNVNKWINCWKTLNYIMCFFHFHNKCYQQSNESMAMMGPSCGTLFSCVVLPFSVIVIFWNLIWTFDN